MESYNKLFTNSKAALLAALCFVSAIVSTYAAVGGFPTIDYVSAPFNQYAPQKPSLDELATRGELEMSKALAMEYLGHPQYTGLKIRELADMFKKEEREIEYQRATKLEVEIAKILFWRMKTDRELAAFDISLDVLERVVIELFRRYGFSIAACQALLVNKGVSVEKSLDYCHNLEPFALLECHALTWLDFSVVMDIKFRMKRRGMYLETRDICRLVERVKPSLIPKPDKKSIFGKCQVVINSELMKSYGITNIDADLMCTLMDYTIQEPCAGLSKEELSQVMKLGLHLGQFLYPRLFPVFFADLCTARRMMRRGPSREMCRNSLVRALIERADELGESVVASQWPLYTDIWRACAYVYKRKAGKAEKFRLDRQFPMIAFGTVWSDKLFRGSDRLYVPSPFAHIHGRTVEEAPEESEGAVDLGESEGDLMQAIDLGSSSELELGSERDMSEGLDLGSEKDLELSSSLGEISLGSSESDHLSMDTYAGSRGKYAKSKSTAPREKWIQTKERLSSTPDKYLWSTRQAVALNSVQKAWGQILFSLYSDAGNKAYNIEDFELIASRIDPANVAKSCARLIYAKIKRYPGTQKDGESSRFSESTIANWCAAIDGSRSVACQTLSTPAFIWSKEILSVLTSFRDESHFAIDLRDVCRVMSAMEPWTFTKKSGFTARCLKKLSEPMKSSKHSNKVSFVEKYQLTEEESKQYCVLMKPANHKSCLKLNSSDLDLAYKLGYRMGKISKGNKKLQITYDAACKVVSRVGRDGTSEHCILATAEFVGLIAVDSEVSGVEFEKGVTEVCEKLFEAREPEETARVVAEIITDIYSDIAKNMPPESRDFESIRRVIVGDKLVEETRTVGMPGYIEDRGFGRFSPRERYGRLYSSSYFKPAETEEGGFWTPFGVDPNVYRRRVVSGPGGGEEKFEGVVGEGFVMGEEWVNINQVSFKKSLAEKLREEFMRTAPASKVVDQSNIPNFDRLVESIDLAPNAIYVSCVKVLTRNRVRSEVAEIVCKRIDPYATPACHGLMVVLLDHAERIHHYLTSMVRKEAFDLSDICKVIYVLNPLSNSLAEIGLTAKTCVSAPIMFSLQRKYSLNNNQMTKLCSKLDFTRTQSFARLNSDQRKRVISGSKVVSRLLADKYQSVYQTHSGVFWARNIPRVSVENVINLVSHTGEITPVKEKCEYECQEDKPFFIHVVQDTEICMATCMADADLEAQSRAVGTQTDLPAGGQRGLRPQYYYDRYGSTEDRKLKKRAWWVEDQQV
ncbi:hypothetical protein FG386_002096 [Cryptosporidium ryanae]|uniref:uncharacterized protein n=1 Tax=Cryptosporidium ryanae TaxID=515981 RepID=UPI00351A8549|nr:hypothetical protein FG386_002096 [Cryptosporidium ryanae]